MKLLVFLLIASSLFASSFERNHRLNVVVDKKNHLMWQDDISVIKVKKTHEQVPIYCQNLRHAGFSNWRVPNIEEYKLIVDKKNELNYINRAFKYNVPDGYWANKAHWRTLWYYADYMHFISGTAYFDSRHKKKYIRCVRDIK
ncbi:hypothetical protein CP960_09315 [Malaciobacter halophilus]|uniref:Lcl C-terminal domain-containing protein n=1 Tax=Malaciobacter halophilus TaxID=197482 RepID=A0A2N1J1U8_9BACT|nr:DUF1566 domain-containing protein [Malaciobacter halophilus]AXH08629.1 DUF1566 domain-containing protein [Malaciobacter halophilus]PKI80474.1 hypothetical protein CP960_09315 [Malaciobacter halophilus]